MNTIKKTLFLSNHSSQKTKNIAILNINKSNTNLFCTLKSYTNIPSDNLILGIKFGDNIIKQNIILNNNTYSFILNNNADLSAKITCVLISNTNDSYETIAWGGENDNNYKQIILANLKDKINKIRPNKINPTPIPQETYNNYTSNYSNDITTETVTPPQNINRVNSMHTSLHDSDLQFNANKDFLEECEDNIYNDNEKEIATATTNTMSTLFDDTEDELNQLIDDNINKSLEEKQEKNEHKFYNMLSEQLDALFDTYPREYNLEKLVDNSKWVKINHEEENKYYVVGIMYENDDIKYICYGVPGSYYTEPPREMQGYSQWLPNDARDPYNNGYWVMYQDADTGENIYLK